MHTTLLAKQCNNITGFERHFWKNEGWKNFSVLFTWIQHSFIHSTTICEALLLSCRRCKDEKRRSSVPLPSSREINYVYQQACSII